MGVALWFRALNSKIREESCLKSISVVDRISSTTSISKLETGITLRSFTAKEKSLCKVLKEGSAVLTS